MRLLIEELDKELPQGWVMLRRTPNTDPADGFIEMHFTGDVDLIAKCISLQAEVERLTVDELTRLMSAMSNDMNYGPSELATEDHMLWRKLERMRALLATLEGR